MGSAPLRPASSPAAPGGCARFCARRLDTSSRGTTPKERPSSRGPSCGWVPVWSPACGHLPAHHHLECVARFSPGLGTSWGAPSTPSGASLPRVGQEYLPAGRTSEASTSHGSKVSTVFSRRAHLIVDTTSPGHTNRKEPHPTGTHSQQTRLTARTLPPTDALLGVYVMAEGIPLQGGSPLHSESPLCPEESSSLPVGIPEGQGYTSRQSTLEGGTSQGMRLPGDRPIH